MGQDVLLLAVLFRRCGGTYFTPLGAGVDASGDHENVPTIDDIAWGAVALFPEGVRLRVILRAVIQFFVSDYR
jgi:hypothetical protein